MSFNAHIITAYPDMFPGPLGASLSGRALKDGLWDLALHDLRDFGQGKHNNIDDTPAGGGPGMVLR
ncbi:MAG: tRNA (guanosine(37)-N1)-methyltransferase TrmD, partial [Parvibaculales bacterium]